MDKCREEFENWAHENKWNIFKFPSGQYVDEFVNGSWHSWQHQQAKVGELQKRVDELEQKISVWKGKSIAALVNGMCKQCGKEPWQGIVSDKAGYTLLHCFSCGANKYEWVGEQALKGEG